MGGCVPRWKRAVQAIVSCAEYLQVQQEISIMHKLIMLIGCAPVRTGTTAHAGHAECVVTHVAEQPCPHVQVPSVVWGW